MESLYFLVPVALIFIALAVKILWWAIHNGQYDNLDTEAHRILFDDEKIKTSESISLSHSTITPTANSPASEVSFEQHPQGQPKL
ncbi:MAG: cbb3-type cytochrome oxidase assembly protein CcoS [Pseudomonadota bacterium]